MRNVRLWAPTVTPCWQHAASLEMYRSGPNRNGWVIRMNGKKSELRVPDCHRRCPRDDEQGSQTRLPNYNR
jgi:hypothetical protein